MFFRDFLRFWRIFCFGAFRIVKFTQNSAPLAAGRRVFSAARLRRKRPDRAHADAGKRKRLRKFFRRARKKGKTKKITDFNFLFYPSTKYLKGIDFFCQCLYNY